MVHYAKLSDKVLAVDTTTNASLLNPRLNEDLIDSGIDRINISINGMGSKGYKDFTGADVDFMLLCKNIEHLYSIRDNTVIYIKINGDYLDDDDKKLFTEIFTPISDGCDIEHIMSCWYDIEVDKKNEDVGVYGQPRENVSICPYIFYSLMIQSSGEVSLCFLDWNKKMIIGDMNIESIKTIWDSSFLRGIRIGMLRGIKNNICAGCDQLRAGMPVNLDNYADEIIKRI
jgi:MoaA/NifB/PqqE/SkfB family radical SAM enzyme